jgi:hypothetical protein
MSRAYRIRVSESLNRTLQAEDEVCSQIELLEVLPPEQMAELLRDELIKALDGHAKGATSLVGIFSKQ